MRRTSRTHRPQMSAGVRLNDAFQTIGTFGSRSEPDATETIVLKSLRCVTVLANIDNFLFISVGHTQLSRPDDVQDGLTSPVLPLHVTKETQETSPAHPGLRRGFETLNICSV